MSQAALACQKKMDAAGVSTACQRAFLANHRVVELGETGFLSESSIAPAKDLQSLTGLPPEIPNQGADLLSKTVVLKLNGGLGTGMGLENAKSLLVVKDGKTFLDFILQNVESIGKHTPNGKGPRFMLMNSFSTTKGTAAFLQKAYPHLAAVMKSEVELMQNQVPKIYQDSFRPVEWPTDPKCEWVPPGHGDLYAALYGSGTLERLLKEGYEYLFVSNSDNLGATVETRILQWMKKGDIPFVMEVCQRTESDKKGGHLARSKTDNRLLLRESAQCPPEEMGVFQDIKRHQYFNTNNLWIDLAALKNLMDASNGMITLPVIRNSKTVDPKNPASPKVFQLETAMGAAVSQFKNASAVLVPRDRFTPVKTCSDLFALRSDAYTETADHRLVLHASCNGQPPVISLDARYALLDAFEGLIARGVPSLIYCTRLTVKGPVQFGGAKIVLKGDVTIEAKDTSKTLIIPDGITLENTSYSG